MADAIETQAIRELYSLRRPEQVQRFLREHSSLLPLLRDGYRQIRKYFPNAPLFLQVVTDPEDATGTHLMAFIRTDQTPVVAFAQLRNLDAEWWLGGTDVERSRFLVTLEFQ